MATLILPLIRARDIVSASSKMFHWVAAIPISLGFESERIPIRDTTHIKDTLIAIIEQFFAENANVLLYICDTSDGREEKRNRLFVRWFEEFATPDRFTMKTANATVEGQGFYAAIIVENTNPMLEAIVGDFKQTAESLTGEKP